MLIVTRCIYGSSVCGPEGDLGTVRDLLFDDATWDLKYLVVHTGGRFTGKSHLLSPNDIDKSEWMGHRLIVHLNAEEVEHSPLIGEHLTAARQGREVSKLIAWDAYWAGLQDQSAEEPSEPHLDSTKEVAGYTLHAQDGEIGHVEDFVIDDTSWHIRYLVVGTGHWLPGKHVLVIPASVKSVSWHQRTIEVDLQREQIKGSPAYDRMVPIDHEYEQRLFEHYGLPA